MLNLIHNQNVDELKGNKICNIRKGTLVFTLPHLVQRLQMSGNRARLTTYVISEFILKVCLFNVFNHVINYFSSLHFSLNMERIEFCFTNK